MPKLTEKQHFFFVFLKSNYISTCTTEEEKKTLQDKERKKNVFLVFSFQKHEQKKQEKLTDSWS